MSFTGERKGRLIVFEGIDGTGKSTHIGHLRKYLEEKGLEVVQSFEPTRGRWGRMLRDSAVTGRLSVEEEVALFLKDRREHVKMLIAQAQVIKYGKRISVFEVKITDENGRLLAQGTYTYYNLGKQIEL